MERIVLERRIMKIEKVILEQSIDKILDNKLPKNLIGIVKSLP
jgi:hypothetical protein